MFSATIVFKHGGVAGFRAHTLEKLTELISEKMKGRADWSSVTYENFADTPGLYTHREDEAQRLIRS